MQIVKAAGGSPYVLNGAPTEWRRTPLQDGLFTVREHPIVKSSISLNYSTSLFYSVVIFCWRPRIGAPIVVKRTIYALS